MKSWVIPTLEFEEVGVAERHGGSKPEDARVKLGVKGIYMALRSS
jgi:hypothetical protein